MKKLLAPAAILAGMLVLLLILTGPNQWRSGTLRRLETLARRPVWFDNFAIQWHHGLGLALKKVTIYSSDQTAVQMQVDEITAVPKPSSFFKKKVELSSVSIRKKEGYIVRDSNGNFALTGLQNPDATGIPIRDLDIMLKNVSGNDPVPVTGSLAVFSKTDNVKVRAVWDPKAPNELSNAHIEVDLGKVNAAELERRYSALAGFMIERIEGTLTIDAEKIVFDRKRVFENPIRVKATGGLFKSARAGAPFEEGEFHLIASDNKISAWDLSFQYSGGRVRVSGNAVDLDTDPKIGFKLGVDAVSFEDIQGLPEQLRDRFKGFCTLTLSGKTGGLSPQSLLKRLTADGHLHVDSGRFIGVGVMRDLLARLPVEAPAGLKAKYGGQDTPFNAADLSFHVTDQGIRSDDISVETEAFTAEGVCRAATSGALKGNFILSINESISGEVIGSDPELAAAANRAGVIQIPVELGGTLDRPVITADMSQLDHMQTGALRAAAAE